jgi:hypothetical protein
MSCRSSTNSRPRALARRPATIKGCAGRLAHWARGYSDAI